MNKLSKLHISLIGGGAALVLALILYFALIRPKNEQIRVARAAINTAESAGGTDQKVAGHLVDYKTDVHRSEVIQSQWRVFEMRYMPQIPLDNKNLLGSYEYSIKDIPTRFGKWITAWYDLQAKMGVRRQPGTDFALPALVKVPNDIPTLDHITLPDQNGKPWNVAVEAKSFNAGVNHLRKFLTMTGHGVPIVDNVSLSGHSPQLLLTYTLGMYIIPRVPPALADPIISAVPMAAGATGAGGGPRGAGAGPGRMMMPPTGGMAPMGAPRGK